LEGEIGRDERKENDKGQRKKKKEDGREKSPIRELLKMMKKNTYRGTKKRTPSSEGGEEYITGKLGREKRGRKSTEIRYQGNWGLRTSYGGG